MWAVPAGGGYTGVPARARSYRGLMELSAAAGPLRMINELDVETYLAGMGEVPGNWPLEAIAAQTVVARTYALRAMSFNGEICDYDLCQVYVGVSREVPKQIEAVHHTRGQVLTFDNALASTVYSSDAGGISATTLEGFGTPPDVYPYLTTVTYRTRYPDESPLVWRVEVGLSDIARRFSYPGNVQEVTVSEAGPSGRALTVTLAGDAADVHVEGREFASRLGLMSTLFVPTMSTAESPPPPLAAVGFLQALPEDTEAIGNASLKGEEQAIAEVQQENAGDLLTSLLGSWTVPLLGAGADDVADDPAAAVALLLVGLATAVAMARHGLTRAGVGVADRIDAPGLRWPSRDEIADLRTFLAGRVANLRRTS